MSPRTYPSCSRPRHLFFAHPVVVREHRHRTADATDDGEHVQAGTLRNDRHEGAHQHCGRIVEGQCRADENGESHHADKRLHQLFEATISTEQHEHKTKKAMEDAAPGLRHSSLCEVTDSEAGGVGQRRGDKDSPQHEVDAEVHLDPGGQILRPSLQRRPACGELPACDPFVEHVFEERAHGDRPQQHDAIPGPTNGRSDNVARSDTGRGHDKTRTRELEKTEGAGRFHCGDRLRGNGHRLGF